MAHLKIIFYSNSLIRPVSFEMIIPNDFRMEQPNKIKTLFLLHGYTGAAGNWISEELIRKYNFAVVMPSGENAFYLDGLSTGRKYATFLGQELVEYVRKTFHLALSAEETYIMGMSMGGFGALHTGLAYPENFGKIGALSSALIIHDIAHMTEEDENPVANYHYYHDCFGDLDTVESSVNNPEVLIKQLKEKDIAIPQMYICCGTEDFLLRNNREFHTFLEENGVSHIYMESAGNHDMIFWSEYAAKIIEWMFG